MDIRLAFYYAIKRLSFPRWERCYEKIRQNPDLGEKALKAVLRHAVTHVPRYRGMQPELDAFPLVAKDDIRTDRDSFLADDYAERQPFENSSGGSTGEPLRLMQDREHVEWNLAAEAWYFRDLLGTDYYAAPKLVLWGSERDIFAGQRGLRGIVVNWLTRTTFVNSFRMTEDDLARAAEALRKRDVVILKGYASSLLALARYVIREGHGPFPRLKLIHSAAETLAPAMRATIEQAFGAPALNFYGSREAGAIAGECLHRSLHAFSFATRLEVLRPDGSAAGPDEEGEAVVTTLHNYAMPLVRYRIGDRAAFARESCPCGSSLPVLARVAGRVTDNFVGPGGTIVHGEYFTHLFYFQDWIREFQVVQETPDRIVIHLAADAEAPQAFREETEEKIRLVMGPDCVIDWRHVEAVPRTPQGKILFTRSLVSR